MQASSFTVATLVFLLVWGGTSCGQPGAKDALPFREKLQIYLLMGQSNMAGVVPPEEEDQKPHPQVWVFTAARHWRAAQEPLHPREGKSGGGVGPGLAFAKNLAEKNTNIFIGLVPCAVGATPLKRWERGGDLYAQAVRRARQAETQGTLAGVLWHQGETDSKHQMEANSYGERLAKMIADLRADLNAPELPVVVGQIGEFLYHRADHRFPFARQVNEALAKLPQNVANTGCVLSQGLTHCGDQTHFDAPSQRDLGWRYALEMERLKKNTASP